jgi:hypothetical protein
MRIRPSGRKWKEKPPLMPDTTVCTAKASVLATRAARV